MAVRHQFTIARSRGTDDPDHRHHPQEQARLPSVDELPRRSWTNASPDQIRSVPSSGPLSWLPLDLAANRSSRSPN
ncbi:hypothetical protein NL676_019372 [Syzygium grande]|nr:hypothetical protein NL676_019372 [Syzygium grande]